MASVVSPEKYLELRNFQNSRPANIDECFAIANTDLFLDSFGTIRGEVMDEIHDTLGELRATQGWAVYGKIRELLWHKAVVDTNTYMGMIDILADRKNKGIEDTPETLVSAWKEYFDFSIMKINPIGLCL